MSCRPVKPRLVAQNLEASVKGGMFFALNWGGVEAPGIVSGCGAPYGVPEKRTVYALHEDALGC